MSRLKVSLLYAAAALFTLVLLMMTPGVGGPILRLFD